MHCNRGLKSNIRARQRYIKLSTLQHNKSGLPPLYRNLIHVKRDNMKSRDSISSSSSKLELAVVSVQAMVRGVLSRAKVFASLSKIEKDRYLKRLLDVTSQPESDDGRIRPLPRIDPSIVLILPARRELNRMNKRMIYQEQQKRLEKSLITFDDHIVTVTGGKYDIDDTNLMIASIIPPGCKWYFIISMKQENNVKKKIRSVERLHNHTNLSSNESKNESKNIIEDGLSEIRKPLFWLRDRLSDVESKIEEESDFDSGIDVHSETEDEPEWQITFQSPIYEHKSISELTSSKINFRCVHNIKYVFPFLCFNTNFEGYNLKE